MPVTAFVLLLSKPLCAVTTPWACLHVPLTGACRLPRNTEGWTLHCAMLWPHGHIGTRAQHRDRQEPLIPEGLVSSHSQARVTEGENNLPVPSEGMITHPSLWLSCTHFIVTDFFCNTQANTCKWKNPVAQRLGAHTEFWGECLKNWA